MIGFSMGSPIVLSPPNDLLGMAITEGIETGLSVYASTGLGGWVAGAAPRMLTLADQIPDYIECVTIYQEADGRQHASKLAQSLIKRGIEVMIAEAPR